MPGTSSYCLRQCFNSKLLIAAQCRRYSIKVLKGDDLGPIHQDEHQSFRVRKDGQQLPLPPILDPIVLSERSRWEQPKGKPNVEAFTPFQKKLWENPYAHILASPIRQCRATQSLLPSALLTSLHPRPHPTTTAPWLLPISLTTPKNHQLGPPYRFLGYKYIAAHLGKKKAWERGLYERIKEKLGKKNVGEMVWREDMAELVQELMRKRLVEKLKWYFGRSGRLIPCASPRSEDIDEIDEVSCILFLGSLKSRADEIHVQAIDILNTVEKWVQYYIKGFPAQLDPHKKGGITHSSPHWYHEPLVPRLQPRIRFPPLEFTTTIWRGRKVAVYSLYDLLGEDKVAELVKGSRYEGQRCLIMRRGRHNVPVEILLMQLQAYLAEPGP